MSVSVGAEAYRRMPIPQPAMSGASGISEDTLQIPASVARELGYYVYLYINPLNGRVFYVGKGRGKRALTHLSDSADSEKAATIREIRAAGHEPRIDILAHGMSDEKAAFLVEAAAIDLLELSNLSNRVRGHRALQYGRVPLQDLVAIYQRRPVEIEDAAVLVRISQLYSVRMSAAELYDVTRGVWRIDAQRAKNAALVMAVFEGTVREVYEVADWLPAGSTFSSRASSGVESPGRWEFVGRVARDERRARYLHADVSEYFPLGNRNPVRYVNV